MRVSKEQAAESRERILEVAARLFREHGFDGIGVSDLMKEAGLTHGGFYGHFKSKEELMARAAERAIEASLQRWDQLQAESGERALERYVDFYLSPEHRDNPGHGCVMAALGSDSARHGGDVREALGRGLQRVLEGLADALPGRSRERRRARAIVTFSSLVGALVLARGAGDAALSDEILRTVALAAKSGARPAA